MTKNERKLTEPTDFGDQEFPSALVLVTNACNLKCKHCFIYREGTPHSVRDKMDDQTLFHQLRVLRDKHKIRSMLFMGGEPMIRKKLVLEAMQLFDRSSIVTNGTYGIPSAPGHLVTVSLDGPEEVNDPIRGKGVFQKVKEAIFERDPADSTTVMLQMVVTRENAHAIEAYVEEVKDWPVSGVAFTFYVPCRVDTSGMAWDDLKERDRAVRLLMNLKKRYPIIKSNIGALGLMLSDRCLEITGEHGEYCGMKRTLPIYMGNGGQFERTFCCYGNNVDCSRCGAYSVFNIAYHRAKGFRRELKLEEQPI